MFRGIGITGTLIRCVGKSLTETSVSIKVSIAIQISLDKSERTERCFLGFQIELQVTVYPDYKHPGGFPGCPAWRLRSRQRTTGCALRCREPDRDRLGLQFAGVAKRYRSSRGFPLYPEPVERARGGASPPKRIRYKASCTPPIRVFHGPSDRVS